MPSLTYRRALYLLLSVPVLALLHPSLLASDKSAQLNPSNQKATMSFSTIPGGKGIAGRLFGPVISYPSAKNAHTATLIMLHGLGDTGNGWAPVAPQLELSHVKWLFPTAPTRPITVNMGMSMPGWFDIHNLDADEFTKMMRGNKGFDPSGVEESVEYVNSLVEQEIKAGIPAERILIGGFSQGGHIALKAALQRKQKLAGCVALSTWLEPTPLNIPDEHLDLPIFYGHGSSDPLIPAPVASASLNVLKDFGLKDVEFKLYPGMQHSTCTQEMQDLRRFLLKVLPEVASKVVTKEEIQAMSARELKAFLQGKGVNPAGMLEKQELLEKAISLL